MVFRDRLRFLQDCERLFWLLRNRHSSSVSSLLISSNFLPMKYQIANDPTKYIAMIMISFMIFLQGANKSFFYSLDELVSFHFVFFPMAMRSRAGAKLDGEDA